jgi:hypothetical protein
MNIGFDLDDTLIFTGIIDRVSRQMGYYPQYNQLNIRDWEFSGWPNELKRAIGVEFCDPLAMVNGVILGNAVETLVELTTRGHYLVCITSRAKSVRRGTMDMIHCTFPMFSELTFVDIGESKEKQFKRHHLDIWVDDNPQGIADAHINGIKCCLISNENTPYNHKYAAERHPGVYILKSVEEICNLLEC